MRILFSIFCFFIISSQCVFAQIDIKISGNPELPVTNLLKNPGFEEGGALPYGWSVEEQAPYFRWSREAWRYSFQRKASGGRNGSAYLRLDVSTSSIISEEALRQSVDVDPGKSYNAGVWVRSRGGMSWVHVFNSHLDPITAIWKIRNSWVNNPLVSDFVPLEWTDSPAPDEWYWLGTEVKSGNDDNKMYFEVSCYQERGSMDFDDAFFGLSRTDLSIKVESADLKKVLLRNDSGELLWDSSELVVGTSKIEHVVQQVSTLSKYEVIVIAADGKETHKWYPELH